MEPKEATHATRQTARLSADGGPIEQNDEPHDPLQDRLLTRRPRGRGAFTFSNAVNWRRRIGAGCHDRVDSFIPDVCRGILYREFFRGRRLLGEHREPEAIDHLQRFLADVRARPWLKPMIWLSWSIYTPDIEAMTLNNIAAANLGAGTP
jgi:hypothetical protein